jgi:hypothetical protein
MSENNVIVNDTVTEKKEGLIQKIKGNPKTKKILRITLKVAEGLGLVAIGYAVGKRSNLGTEEEETNEVEGTIDE